MDGLTARVEMIRQGEAIVSVHDGDEWIAGGLIQVRSGLPEDLLSEARRAASLTAAAHGRVLASVAMAGASGDPITCGACIKPPLPRRPGNALNVEIGAPLDRCLDKRPRHWPASMSAIRWLGSGGSPLILGACTPRACPRARGGR